MWKQALDIVRPAQPPRDAVAARAYEKHIANPTAVDRSIENWLDAERELLAELRSRVGTRGPQQNR
jgi:hypothetical protein